MNPETLATSPERMRAVLEDAFGGWHHVPQPVHQIGTGTLAERWEVSTYADLSTHDGDILTRLVLAAHRHCVRVSVQPSGPGMVKIALHPRFSREGSSYTRHPDLAALAERAVAR